MTFTVTTDRQEILLGWAARRIGLPDGWSSDSEAMGVVDAEEKLRAVAVINQVAEGNCLLHIASDGRRSWATRSVLGVLFSYPFYILGLRKVTARVAIDNVPSQVLCLKLGFQFEGRERAAFFGRDTTTFGMLRDECSWLADPEEDV